MSMSTWIDEIVAEQDAKFIAMVDAMIKSAQELAETTTQPIQRAGPGEPQCGTASQNNQVMTAAEGCSVILRWVRESAAGIGDRVWPNELMARGK